MQDWDTPKKSRAFLAAALLIAACGIVIRWDEPLPTLGTLGAAAFASASAANASTAEDRSGPAGTGSEALFEGEVFPIGAELHDAVASLGALSSQQSSSRSSAFNAPVAKTAFGAFVPAGAAASQAAHRAGEALAARAPSPRAAGSPASSSRAAVESAAADADASPARVAAGTNAAASRPRAEKRYDTEKFFALEAARRPTRPAGSATGADEDAPEARSAARARQGRLGRLKPVLLSALLGRGALKAPLGVKLPKSAPWKDPIPAATPDGRKITPAPLGTERAEEIAPPAACRRVEPHWHSTPGLDWSHSGRRWGRWDGRAWAWIERHAARWWAWPQPARRALLRHQDHWWLQSRGLWFLLHEGQPWGYRYLSEWERDGFEHASGAQMVYSADGSRVGMIVPGEGAVLYDAVTGEELGRWTQEQLPRRRLSAPNRLPSLP